MASISLFQRVKDIESQIGTTLSHFDVDSLSLAERNLLTTLKNQVIDARLEVRDYEYADTRVSQLQHAAAGKKQLYVLQQNIVKASEYGLFSAIDVAQLTAHLESIAEQLS